MSSLAQQMREVRALKGGEERAESWLFQQHGGEDGEMDSVQRGMDLFLGLCCVGEQVDLWQTHTILICAQPDNASQGQNSSAQCFLTGCFFNYMSEAIKLRRRFSHKALFYVSVITVNYKATRKETYGRKNAKRKVGLFISLPSCFCFYHPVGTLIILKPYDTLPESKNFRALTREEDCSP